MTDKISFAILDYIVTQGPLLTEVQEFLDTVGEKDLSQSLAKLEQDAGLQVFNDIGMEDSEDRPAEEDLHATRYFIGETNPEILPLSSTLLNNRGYMTYGRLAVLHNVAASLEKHGAPFAPAYADMLKSLTAMIPANAKEIAAAPQARWDLI